MKKVRFLNVNDTVYLVNSSQILTCTVTELLPFNFVSVLTGPTGFVRIPRNLPIGYEIKCNKELYYVTLDVNDLISKTLMRKKYVRDFENICVILKHVSQNLNPDSLQNLTKELQILSNKYYAHSRTGSTIFQTK